MHQLNADRLHVRMIRTSPQSGGEAPRRYTIAYSPRSESVSLTIGPLFDQQSMSTPSGLVQQLFLGEWQDGPAGPVLNIFADSLTDNILPVECERFQKRMALILQAVRYGDAHLFTAYPDLDHAPIVINLRLRSGQNCQFEWGTPADYMLMEHRVADRLKLDNDSIWVSLTSDQYSGVALY